MKPSVFAVLICLLLPSIAPAYPYSGHISFTGHITDVRGEPSGYGFEFDDYHVETGDLFSGYLYYSLTEDYVDPVPASSVYEANHSSVFIVNYGIFIDSLILTSGSGQGITYVSQSGLDSIYSNTVADSFSVGTYTAYGIHGERWEGGIGFHQNGSSNLGGFNFTRFFTDHDEFPYGQVTTIYGEFDNITMVQSSHPVPEPATILLLLSCGGVVFLKRKLSNGR